MEYFSQVKRGGFPPSQKLILQRIEMQPVPAIGLSDDAFAPCYQICESRKPTSIVYSNCNFEVA